LACLGPAEQVRRCLPSKALIHQHSKGYNRAEVAVSDFLHHLRDLDGPSHGPCRAILEAFPQSVLVVTADGSILFANTRAQSAIAEFGLKAGQRLTGAGAAFDFVDPETDKVLAPAETPVGRALAGDSIVDSEYMIRRRKPVARFWLEVSAQPLKDESAAVAGVLFCFRRIGEKKKREAANEAAEKLGHVIDRANLSGIIHVTVDGRILDCNDAIVDMLGYPSKKDLLRLRAPDLCYDPVDRDLALQRPGKYEVCCRRADGSRCWALLNSLLMDAPPGEAGGTIISSVFDITERKRQEDAVRQSDERFSAFMKYLPGVAFIKDLTGRYLYYSPASSTLFGIDPEDIVGKTAEEVWPAEHAVVYRAGDEKVIESGRPLESVAPVPHPGGVHQWLFYRFPIFSDGSVSMVAGIGVDITEKMVLEEQLSESRRMEALGRLAGGVAHDFNNLLTVISGYAQLGVEGLGNIPDDRLFSYLREILDSSRRASDLTGQLLAYSRRQTVDLSTLNLSQLVSGMDRLLQRILGEHIEITVVCDCDRCFIRADTTQMEQAIINMAVNSRDAMPLGGQLSLHCGWLAEPRLQGEGPPLSIVLEIRDNGIGMDAETSSRIFEAFYTSKPTGRGTGLGLSTVLGVMKDAGGKIELETTPGEGTVFRLLFPAMAESGDEVPPSPSASVGGAETVLLVEDEAAVRDLVETMLSRFGYRVLPADSGPAALRIWEESGGAIDVLLTDVIMPHMSGGDLAHRLRAVNPRLRVLFMSGYTDDMISSHGMLGGDTQLLQKPFTAEALGRKLRDVLDA
jgi:two-component system cell cycle sensor histidine kinase/response regulator CckA